MKYKDLVQFEPVESIKVLTEADDEGRARDDVRTFVFSAHMLGQLEDVVVPHLRIDTPHEQGNKGLLTVANYGTGKTHLMSVISGVADHEDLLDELTSDDAKDALKPIAGRFRVIRAEIGATNMPLRNIVVKELEEGLKDLDVAFTFPSLEEVTNSKDSLAEMMAAFEAVHPDRGLFFVLDELLDFLRGRKDAELNLDLRFLREVGEISKSTRFRFIAGVQEALFDNPRFANVASEVQRVKERFEQVRISREDIAHVVKQRLLKKTTEQRDKIRDHLQPFTPLYEGMAERLDDFVELFPVHPAYLRVFEQVTAVEKREVLKTLSREMGKLLSNDVPTGEPGLVCYDSYRERLSEDPSFRQIPEVREVLEKTDVLRNKIERAMPTKAYIPTALRVIDGLTIHRLTTDDIYVPIGVTRRELRDDLCLLPPNLPEQDAMFLEATIGSIVEQAMKAVSGQFITENVENDQIYLDLKKDIDYDQRITERATTLDEDRLDDAYFRALEQVLERRDAPYVSGYRIWEYELPWSDKRVGRLGYLFMGAPNERSTAQPPRDFYIYFLQPYDPPKFTDDEKGDEVFFRLEQPDDDFTAALRNYAGATALATESTSQHRSVYEDKAQSALQAMVTWLKKRMGQAVTVTYKGKTQPLEAWLGGAIGPRGSVKDQVDTIATKALTDHFDLRYPGYPAFLLEITRHSIEESARQALVQIALGRKTEMSGRVLQSLELIDAQGNVHDEGTFAKALKDRLAGSGGKALNRQDLLTERDPGVFSWEPWFLEPIWLVVVAAALTQLGRAEIGFTGTGQVDALGLEQLTKKGKDDLEAFSHIAPPKALPVVQLREVAKLLGQPPGVVGETGITEPGAQQLLAAASDLLQRVATARAALQDGVNLWGALVVEQQAERDTVLAALQRVLEDVKARNSVGKMNKLALGNELLDGAKKGVAQLAWIETAVEARTHLADVVEYLREASEVFGSTHDLSKDAATYRNEVLELFRQGDPPDPTGVAKAKKAGEDLRRRFADEAARAHARDRLDGQGDQRKRKILEGEVYRDIRKLTAVSLLPQGAFASLERQLVEIGTCLEFDETSLTQSVICTACGYRPAGTKGATAQATVEGIDDRLRDLRDEWVRTLLDTLKTGEMQAQINLLQPAEQDAVREFLDSEKLPSPLDEAFVKTLNQVFQRFEVRPVSREEVWKQLFPEQTAATVDELHGRFDGMLKDLAKGANSEQIRVVPKEDEE